MNHLLLIKYTYLIIVFIFYRGHTGNYSRVATRWKLHYPLACNLQCIYWARCLWQVDSLFHPRISVLLYVFSTHSKIRTMVWLKLGCSTGWWEEDTLNVGQVGSWLAAWNPHGVVPLWTQFSALYIVLVDVYVSIRKVYHFSYLLLSELYCGYKPPVAVSVM